MLTASAKQREAWASSASRCVGASLAGLEDRKPTVGCDCQPERTAIEHAVRLRDTPRSQEAVVEACRVRWGVVQPARLAEPWCFPTQGEAKRISQGRAQALAGSSGWVVIDSCRDVNVEVWLQVVPGSLDLKQGNSEVRIGRGCSMQS